MNLPKYRLSASKKISGQGAKAKKILKWETVFSWDMNILRISAGLSPHKFHLIRNFSTYVSTQYIVYVYARKSEF